MGFRLRKSVKVGPFHINFSKSGVGWSIGGKSYGYTKKNNKSKKKNYAKPPSSLGSNHNPHFYGAESFMTKLKRLYYSQFEIKENSILDNLAKWIDKKFFGSDYNLTSEKLMIIALVTNILGLHRVYAGHKFAAVMGWLYLICAFRASSNILPFLLMWVIIDMILIYSGGYGRLRDKQMFQFNRFKALITYKARAKNKAISGGISLALMLSIAVFGSHTGNTVERITEGPNRSIIAVSSTDSSTTSTEPQTRTMASADDEKKTTEELVASTTASTMPAIDKTTTIVTNESTTNTKNSTIASTKQTTAKKPTTTTKQTTTTKSSTTASRRTTTQQAADNGSLQMTIILNTNTHVFHTSSNCRAVRRMNSANKRTVNSTIADVKSQGYSACGICSRGY